MQARTIRSFINRQRRLSHHQQKILHEGWRIYGLEISAGEAPINKILTKNAQLVLEIGFGAGTTILNYAHKYPHQNILGIEVYQPGIVALLTQLKTHPLNNIYLYREDAILVLQQCVPDASLSKVLIFFPDPWPKRRHHKRRLIQPQFIELLQKKLKPQGILHIATDWEDYANFIISVLKNNKAFIQISSVAYAVADRIPTKFAHKGMQQNHPIFDLLFVR